MGRLGGKGERGVRVDPKVSGPSNWKDAAAIY